MAARWARDPVLRAVRRAPVILAPAERRVHRRRVVEVDLLDVGPGHVLGALTAVDEDQHAGIPLAKIASALELQLLTAMEGHPGTLGAAFFAAGGHDRGDQAEGDGVVHALEWGVERLGGLALVEVVDQPAGEAAAGAGGDAARERAPRREVAVGGATAAVAEVDATISRPSSSVTRLSRERRAMERMVSNRRLSSPPAVWP